MISIVIPAHNEEKYIGKCLESVALAAWNISTEVEVVVVLNRCTDKTEKIAKDNGALIVTNGKKNLASIRNSGVMASSGDVIVTLDADSWMKPNMLSEVERLLGTGKYIGGGSRMHLDRFSIGIFFSLMAALPQLLPKGAASAGMFWLHRKDFDAIGGFDESFVSSEDVYFAVKLKAHGKRQGKKYGTIFRSYIVTSARKFNQFGDWHMLVRKDLTRGLLDGKDQSQADKYYYDAER